MMRNIAKLLLLSLLSISFLGGCAYVRFTCEYDVQSEPNHGSLQHLAKFLEEYFISKGLRLKEKYSILFPDDLDVIVLEIPREAKEKRKDATLFIYYIRRDDMKQLRQEVRKPLLGLEQSEWFISSLTMPTSNKPEDLVESLKKEIAEKAKDELNLNIMFTLSKKSHK